MKWPVADTREGSPWGSSSPVVISFLVGAVSSSIVCWWTFGRGRGGNSEGDLDDEEKAPWMMRSLSMEDIASRIGELPSRTQRMHWPWNKSRRAPSERHDGTARRDDRNGASTTQDTTAPTDDSTNHAEPPQEKTGPCIGSIFGLDVGGTLAKLVYFEQGTTEDHSSSHSHRQLLYHRAASAQVVLEARRAQQQGSAASARSSEERQRRRSSTTELPSSRPPALFHSQLRRHSTEVDPDFEQLYRMRQESVPAHLSEYGSAVRENSEEAWREHTDGTRRRQPLDDFHVDASTTVPSSSSRVRLPRDESAQMDTSKEDGNEVKKSRSMLDLSATSRDHAEALDRFYSFARRLDTYDTTVKDKNLSFYSRELGGEFHFIRFETRQMHNAMDLIRVNKLHLNIVEMGATGGGAHKYASDWERMLGIQIVKQEELDSLVAGMQFVLSTVVGECYTYRPKLEERTTTAGSSHGSSTTDRDEDAGENGDHAQPVGMTMDQEEEADEEEPPPARVNGHGEVKTMIDGWWYSRKVQRDVVSYSSTYPYLLVTIGTGVSILRVDGPRKHTRVSGSTIGGGTYWGLIRLLTDVETFEDAMSLAGRGDPSKVDMMVGDIYGKNSDALEKLGLPSDLVASSFGKLVTKADPASGLKQEDLARALLLMVTINIGQVAYLNAQLYKTPRIYFVGNFLRNNTISQRRLSYAIDYWSKGKMEALFLEHEGYFGALGAFLLSQGVTNGEDGFFQRTPPQDSAEAPSNGSSSSDSASQQHRRVQTMSSLL